MTSKVCLTCSEEKPFSEFHKNRNGYKPHCKPCRAIIRKGYSNGRVGKQAEAEAHLKSRYGISKEDWLSLLEKQGGVCAICGETPESFHVDHCHNSKKVRGLLCFGCNIGLGHFKDNPKRLSNAIKYLLEDD